jgi:uncharacterized LabA/DUF88 family protein
MTIERTQPSRLAVLIDADNAQPSVIEKLLPEVAKYGVAVIRRAYGDWTTPSLGGWKSVLLDHAIQPIQQFRYTVGKNATDSAMIIDAMDLLHARRFDGFCLISSDSDFTGLARRIREEGLLALGAGERKTPPPFIAACDRFIFTDLFGAQVVRTSKAVERRPEPAPLPVQLLGACVEAAADESGWAYLSQVGAKIVQQEPDFDARRYGHKTLSALFTALPRRFEMVTREQGNGVVRRVRIRAGTT